MKTKGQALFEYAMLLAILVVSVIFMSVYVRRAIVGRVLEESEKIGERYAYGLDTTSRSMTNYTRNITVDVAYFEGKVNSIEYYIQQTKTNTNKDLTERDSDEIILY